MAGRVQTSPSSELTRVALWKLAAALDTTIDLFGSETQGPPGRADSSRRPVLTDLDSESCRELISADGVGRIVCCHSRGPVALPVNFRILDGDVVVRSDPTQELNSSLRLENVSFEVDHIDGALAERSSVVIPGRGAGGVRDVHIRIVSGK